MPSGGSTTTEPLPPSQTGAQREKLDAIERLYRARSGAGQGAGTLPCEVLLAGVDLVAILMDTSGVVVEATGGALRMGGVERADAIGKPLWEIGAWASRRDAEPLREAIAAAVAGRTVRLAIAVASVTGSEPLVTPVEVRPVAGPTGAVRFVLAQSARAARGQGGEDAAVIEQLTRMIEQRDRLVSETSHNMRGPLVSIAARAERLLAHPDEAVQLEAGEVRVAALQSLGDLNDFSDLGRFATRRSRLRMSDCDLVDVVRTVVRQFEPIAGAADVVIETRTPRELVARCDCERVTHIVANLVGNGVRYASRPGRVRCELRREGKEIIVEVGDNGPGIAARDRTAVFEREWRSETSRRLNRHGRGLGLAIVHEAVRLHRGTVTVSNAPEGGALLVVRLPYAAPAGTGGPTVEEQVSRALVTETVVADVHNYFARRRHRGDE